MNKFNSDTVGTKPGNITEVNGTILVASHSSQGQAMETQTINSGNSAVFNLDLFSSASDYSVT